MGIGFGSDIQFTQCEDLLENIKTYNHREREEMMGEVEMK